MSANHSTALPTAMRERERANPKHRATWCLIGFPTKEESR